MQHHHQVRLSAGRSYHYVDYGSERAPVLLCIHGFPDLWYGWRHQIHPWVAEGYRVIVPDMLGYGQTDMPQDASAYSAKRLCDDLAALLDHVGAQKAVVIGHDWGSFIASRFALWYPERLVALALLSVPYTPPSAHYVSVEQIAQRYPSYGYQVYLASEKSTSEIETHLPSFFQLMFGSSQETLSWVHPGLLQKKLLGGQEPKGCMLNDEELNYYVSNFKRGMIGPLSYYRTTRFRFEEEKDAALPSKLCADLPVLFLYGSEDAACPPMALRNSGKFIERLKIVPIPGVGHWVMIEAPKVVTDAILQWLASVLGPGSPARL